MIAGKVQDPYCLRCVPQVHGASRDALTHILNVMEIEINSVTDNPLVFEDERPLAVATSTVSPSLWPWIMQQLRLQS